MPLQRQRVRGAQENCKVFFGTAKSPRTPGKMSIRMIRGFPRRRRASDFCGWYPLSWRLGDLGGFFESVTLQFPRPAEAGLASDSWRLIPLCPSCSSCSNIQLALISVLQPNICAHLRSSAANSLALIGSPPILPTSPTRLPRAPGFAAGRAGFLVAVRGKESLGDRSLRKTQSGASDAG